MDDKLMMNKITTFLRFKLLSEKFRKGKVEERRGRTRTTETQRKIWKSRTEETQVGGNPEEKRRNGSYVGKIIGKIKWYVLNYLKLGAAPLTSRCFVFEW